MLHPREARLQKARAFQRSEAFAPYRQLRQVAEHRLARLMQLGLRQARCVGRAKTLGQLFLAATVANLALVATKVGLMRGRSRRQRQLYARLLGLVGLLITLCLLSVGLRRPRQYWPAAAAPEFLPGLYLRRRHP